MTGGRFAEKAALRRALRRALRGLDPEAVRMAPQRIGGSVSEILEAKACRTVAAYGATKEEPELRMLWAHGFEMCVPRIEGEQLSLRRTRRYEDLVPGVFGILEAAEGAPVVAREAVDAIVVPGLGFSKRDGMRLGRGGGYYDRLLEGYAGWKIGVCFEAQVVEEIPREPHDCAMDVIVTESGSFWLRG